MGQDGKTMNKNRKSNIEEVEEDEIIASGNEWTTHKMKGNAKQAKKYKE